MISPKKIMLLGSGELGKEFIISAQRLGMLTIAVDKYKNAPAMQVADFSEVIDMLDGKEIQRIAKKYKPDFLVPEIESIRTEELMKLEDKGYTVIPTAKATYMTMNRDAIRDLAHQELKLRTARYLYAETIEELVDACDIVGFPCVVKPVMSSSGKGQSVVKNRNAVKTSWKFACDGMRGDKKKVIVEEFIPFETEITLLTVKQANGRTLFVNPIGHRQERGDYQESWQPANIKPELLKKAQKMAKKITDSLGGSGIFGVEFFITKDDVVFSELSPRPHDTGMVTLVSQNLSEFDLHLRAILGLPIPQIDYYGPAASSVILADRPSQKITFSGVEKALETKGTEIRIFGKPNSRKFRRMGVALATANSTRQARTKANKAAQSVRIRYT